MGALTPVLPLLSGVGTVMGAVGSYQSQRQAAKAQAAQAQQQADSQALAYEQRRRRLERQKRITEASAKAQLAANGGGSSDGSGAAFLQSITKAAADDERDLYQNYQLNQKSRNLLDDGEGGQRLSLLAELLKTPRSYNRYL